MAVANRSNRRDILSKIAQLKVLDNMGSVTIEQFSEHRGRVVIQLQEMKDRLEDKKVDVKAMKEKADVLEYIRDASAFGSAIVAAMSLPAAIPTGVAVAGVLVASTLLVGSWINRAREFHEVKKARSANIEASNTVNALTEIIEDLSNEAPREKAEGGITFNAHEYHDNVKQQITPTWSDLPQEERDEIVQAAHEHSPLSLST